MSDNNDANTRNAAMLAHDRVTKMLDFFSYRDATWEEYNKDNNHLELLKLDLTTLAEVVEHELQRRYVVEPIEFGM